MFQDPNTSRDTQVLRKAKGHLSQRNEMAQQLVAWASPETMACASGTQMLGVCSCLPRDSCFCCRRATQTSVYDGCLAQFAIIMVEVGIVVSST